MQVVIDPRCNVQISLVSMVCCLVCAAALGTWVGACAETKSWRHSLLFFSLYFINLNQTFYGKCRAYFQAKVHFNIYPS